MDKLIYEEKVPINKTAFVAKVREISERLNINPNWLMLLMNFETAGTMSHTIVNNIGATGLIQFMPNTAIGLGTTTAELRQMTNVEQLEYVYKYLKPYKRHYNSLTDLYLAIFYPAALGKGADYVITSDAVAKANPVFDLNKDLDISVKEIETVINSRIPQAWLNEFSKKKA